MSSYIIRALHAAVAAGVALCTLGFAGPGAPAVAAAPSLGPPVYTAGHAGYTCYGRWFRFVSATLTIPPRTVPAVYGGNMLVVLHFTPPRTEAAVILVRPGGGAGTVEWGNSQKVTPFVISPRVGDRMAVSIYYDRHGHDYFTATDLTRRITKTARVTVGKVTYDKVSLWDNVTADVSPPATGIRQWKVTGTRLTTYTGQRGTVTGPWHASQVIDTSTGTPAGRVIASPSRLWNGGANFGMWLRALPLDYNSAFAGYRAGGGLFRFVATTLIVPPLPAASGNATLAVIGLYHGGGPTPRPYGYIRVESGGGPGSVTYDCLYLPAVRALAVSPRPGDRLSVSVYYDQHGHLRFTAADLTQGTSATVTTAAQLAGTSPYNGAGLQIEIDNSKVSPPPADTRLWAFTATRITTYNGVHGSVLGPWATSEPIDTTTGTPAGPVVMSTSVLSNAGHNFGVWLRHH